MRISAGLYFIAYFFILNVVSEELIVPNISNVESCRINENEPIVFFITPTHKYVTQLVDLMRMIEDSTECCRSQIRQILQRSGVMYTHVHKLSTTTANAGFGFKFNKGINQRNFALEIIEKYYLDNPSAVRDAILYFADADNAYDARLVEELIQTRRLGVLPVAFTAQNLYERCLVDNKTGLVSGFVGWKGGRRYPVDMAGFAFSVQAMLQNKPRFKQTVKMGRLESNFITILINSMTDIEPLADNCTRIYVWHTRTDARIPRPDDREPNPGDSQSQYEKIKMNI